MYHRGEEDAVRTKPSGDEITQLPPAPAPTARDANPWQTSGAARPPKRLTSIRTPRGRDPVTRPAREGMRNLVALGIVAFILVSGVLEALQGGGPEALIGMVVPLFILAILFLARRNKSKRRGRSGVESGADGD
jgi:hypothetical protein